MFRSFERPTATQLNAIINEAEFSLSPDFDSTSTSYVDFTGASMTFAKRMSSTQSDLRIELFASAFLVASPPEGITLGVRIGSTDYDVSRHNFDQALIHHHWSFFRRITGIAAGTYTVQVRAKNNSAGKTVRFNQPTDFGGQLGMIVKEMLL